MQRKCINFVHEYDFFTDQKNSSQHFYPTIFTPRLCTHSPSPHWPQLCSSAVIALLPLLITASYPAIQRGGEKIIENRRERKAASNSCVRPPRPIPRSSHTVNCSLLASTEFWGCWANTVPSRYLLATKEIWGEHFTSQWQGWMKFDSPRNVYECYANKLNGSFASHSNKPQFHKGFEVSDPS